MQRSVLLMTFGISGLVPLTAVCAPQQDITTWATVHDFMVQDVCVDDGGKIEIGVSPLDARCKHHRNLAPADLLPYHKHDWPGDADKKSQAQGYQRSDSFPINTKAYGQVAIQTFDFGNTDRAFSRFDHGDGGQIVAYSDQSASIILTEDGSSGLQLMAGAQCRGNRIDPRFLLDSWMVAGKSAEAQSAGQDVATLRIVTDPACPGNFDFAYTEWHFADHRFRTSLDGARGTPLRTLVSSHYGGKKIDVADHLERFYFTRELGWTRWERWQNLERNEDAERRLAASRRFATTGRCQPIEPAPSSGWGLVDCREWTNIAGPESPKGDKPEFWLDRLQANPMSSGLLSE